MRLTARICAAAFSAAALAACGYKDDNLQAARVVTQAYLQGWSDRDPAAICRVLGPGQWQMFAGRGGGSCELGVAAGFGSPNPPLRAGAAKEVGDGVIEVQVSGHPLEPITLLHLASTWRVVGGWKVS